MRILIILLFASLVPTIWLAGFLNQRMSDILRNAEEDSAINYLQQFSHTTELILKNIEDTVHLLRMNNDFISYQRLSDKNYFQNFHDHYNLDRISEYSRFLKLRASINSNLEKFATTSEFIQSVYFYDPQVREVFSLEYIPSPIQSFAHREWYPELPGMEDSTLIGPVLNKNRQQVLYMVYPELDNSEMVFIININLNAFYRFLWNQIQPRNTDLFFILDNDGNPIIYNSTDEKNVRTLAWTLDSNENSLRDIVLDKETLLVSSFKSQYLGWSFHAVNDRTEFARIFSRNRKYMAIVMIPLLLINLILLFVLRNLLYSPIHKVMNHVTDEEVDNLDGLEKWIDHTVLEKEEREDLLIRTIPAYQLSFLKQLLDGNESKENPGANRKVLKQLNLPFNDHLLRVALFFPSDSEQMARSFKILSHYCEELNSGTVCLKKNNYLVLIMDGESKSHEEICSILDNFIIRTDREESLRLYGAISLDNWAITDIYEGFLQAERGLKDYLKVPFGTPFIELGRAYGTELSPLILSDDFSDQIIDLLKNDEKDKSVDLLEHQFAELSVDGREYSPSEVQHYYINLVSSLLIRLRDQGFDFDLNRSGKDDLFVSLIGLRTQEAIHQRILKFIDEIYRLFSESNDGGSAKNYIRTAEALIENQVGDNISLSIIAEQMGISSFYLSRLFKEVRNESFTDYLKLIRMKKARVLLENPDLKVQDVSRQIGYWSSNYFIKVFRKFYGVTPGEFRNTLKNK
jgi:two-component system, response regulator YesN